MAPTGQLFGSQQHPDNNLGVSGSYSANTPCKDTQFGQPSNRFHPLHKCCHLPLPPPYWGASMFCHPGTFSMTPSSKPSSVATKQYPSYVPPWETQDFPQSGYHAQWLFPPQQFTGQRLSSPGTAWVPPALPENYAVLWLTSSASTPPGHLSGAPMRPTARLPMKQFQQVVEVGKRDVAEIANFLPWLNHSYA